MMETRNLLVLIALAVLSAVILFKVFQIDANQKIVRDNINKSIQEIEGAGKKLAAAETEIEQLQLEIKRFKIERDILETQKDSIVLAFQKKQARDWEELQEIKENIEENIDELSRLRELNQRFQ